MKKGKEYSDMAKVFFIALQDRANKGDIRTCMRLAGYSDTTPVSYIIESYSEEIVDIANKLIASHAVKAAASMIEVLDDPNSAFHKNTIAAANSILDRAGLSKKGGDEVNLKVPGGGLLILPAKSKSDSDGEGEVNE